MRLRARGIEVGFGVLQLHLIVSRIEFDQQRSGFHELIVLHFRIDIGHRAADSGTDRIQVPLHLRVVGGFVTARVRTTKLLLPPRLRRRLTERATESAVICRALSALEIPRSSRYA